MDVREWCAHVSIGGNLHNLEIHDLFSSHIIRLTNSRGRGGREQWKICWIREMRTEFWWGNLKEREN